MHKYLAGTDTTVSYVTLLRGLQNTRSFIVLVRLQVYPNCETFDVILYYNYQVAILVFFEITQEPQNNNNN